MARLRDSGKMTVILRGTSKRYSGGSFLKVLRGRGLSEDLFWNSPFRRALLEDLHGRSPGKEVFRKGSAEVFRRGSTKELFWETSAKELFRGGIPKDLRGAPRRSCGIPPRKGSFERPPRSSAEPRGASAELRGAPRRTSGKPCLLYTSPSPRDQRGSRMPSSA